MENETDNIVESENNEQVEVVEEVKVEKPKRTPQEELEYFEGRAKRLRKDLGLETEPKSEPKEEKLVPKSGELNIAEMAFLQGNDIRGKEEFAIVQKYKNDTGKSLLDLVDENSIVGKLIRSEIKELREAKTTSEATPKGTKRSSPSPKDSVDYWIKKPFDQVPDELKIQVVNRRIELDQSKNPFAKNQI